MVIIEEQLKMLREILKDKKNKNRNKSNESVLNKPSTPTFGPLASKFRL